jgi:hypothetical protein
LDAIWLRQDIGPATTDALRVIVGSVQRSLTDPPGGRNVTEWAKKQDAWDRIRDLDIALPKELDGELIDVRRPSADSDGSLPHGLSEDETERIKRVAAISGEVWFALSRWARETNNLAGWQRSIAFTLGRYASSNRPPSSKQAVQAEKILREAQRLGFRLEGSVPSP